MIVGFLLLGWWLDGRLGTTPTLTLVGLGLGTFGGFWNLFRTARQLQRDMEADDEAERKAQRRSWRDGEGE